MKINLVIPSPRELSLNFLRVAVESEIDFLTDALKYSSSSEDSAEYGRRLQTMKLLDTILDRDPEVIEFGDHEEDWSAEDTATAVEKLLEEQVECRRDTEDPEEIIEFTDRIQAGTAILSILRPNRPEHYGSRH